MKYQLRLLGIFVIAILFTTTLCNAQVMVGGIEEYIDYANIVATNSGANNKYSEMKGTPFLNEKFEEGRVNLRNGKIYEGPLRYDIYSDQIEFETEDGLVYEIRNPETVEKVSIGKHNFLCFVKEDGRELDGIFEELANGNLTLLVKHKVSLKDAVPAKPYIEARPATFIKKKSIFWVINTEGKVVPLDGKKDALALDVKREDEINGFIKKNKLRLGEKNDIIELIDYLNVSK